MGLQRFRFRKFLNLTQLGHYNRGIDRMRLFLTR